MTMHPETEKKLAKHHKWLTKKADLLEEIENYEHQLETLKAELKDTEADILPDPENKQLNIRVHSASRPAANRALAQLFEHLNKAEVNYPGTDFRLVYKLGGYTGSNGAEGVT
jgi:hypothetical protein